MLLPDTELLLPIMGIILLYIFICYCAYRIIRKFTPNITVVQTLIPVVNVYLLAKLVTPTRAGIVSMIFLFANNDHYYEGTLYYVAALTSCFLRAWLFGNIAKRLGKNFWLHAVLAYLYVPLLITIPIMAFDNSRPTNDITKSA